MKNLKSLLESKTTSYEQLPPDKKKLADAYVKWLGGNMPDDVTQTSQGYVLSFEVGESFKMEKNEVKALASTNFRFIEFENEYLNIGI